MGDGCRDLVLVHGWAFSDLVWESTAHTLTGDYRCVLVNLPGHNAISEHSLTSYARSICKHVRDESVWVGWSLGGMVAMQAALDYPLKVRALSLVASTPRFTRAPDWPCGVPPSVLMDFAQELKSHESRTLSRFIALQTRSTPNARQVTAELKRALAEPTDSTVLRAGLRLLAESDLRERLGNLQCPVQFILGELDALVPSCLASNLERLCPEWSCEVLARAGHAPFLSTPAEYRRTLETFLRASA